MMNDSNMSGTITSTSVMPLANISKIIELEDLSMAVFIITFVPSVVSIIATIGFVYAFIKYKNNDSYNTLLTCLTIANGLTCFGVVMGAFHYKKDIPFGNSGAFCVIQSILCTYFDMVADIYTLFVQINICCRIAFGYICMRNRNAKLACHTSALTIPLMIVLAAIWRNALGDSASLYGSWCWISDSLSNQEKWIWMVVTKQGWELVVYFGTCFMFIIILYQRCRNQDVRCRSRDRTSQNNLSSINVPNERTRLRNSGNSSEDTEYAEASVNSVLVWVGIYFYLAKMWGTIRYGVNIYMLAFNDEISNFLPLEKYFLIFMQSLGDSLQATITFCIFVLKDNELRGKLSNDIWGKRTAKTTND
ncbi:G-protein coupled receptor 157-like [Ylistrum balloti]|uniref:G-protein coupled receptor 157-like n=1 Tax=Ylistrum balloti TaxID=509963 RepID=UPI002905E37B|nr:G-protein coupled receptor 157-like [Ylistrum balloti]